MKIIKFNEIFTLLLTRPALNSTIDYNINIAFTKACDKQK